MKIIIGILIMLVLLFSFFALIFYLFFNFMPSQKAVSLQEELVESVPVFEGADVLSQGLAGNDLLPAEQYTVSYKIDGTVATSSVIDFYRTVLPENGWSEVEANNSGKYTYSKGERELSIYFSCHSSESVSTGILKHASCSEYSRYYYLGVRLYIE